VLPLALQQVRDSEPEPQAVPGLEPEPEPEPEPVPELKPALEPELPQLTVPKPELPEPEPELSTVLVLALAPEARTQEAVACRGRFRSHAPQRLDGAQTQRRRHSQRPRSRLNSIAHQGQNARKINLRLQTRTESLTYTTSSFLRSDRASPSA
jgi:hypothetical protein